MNLKMQFANTVKNLDHAFSGVDVSILTELQHLLEHIKNAGIPAEDVTRIFSTEKKDMVNRQGPAIVNLLVAAIELGAPQPALKIKEPNLLKMCVRNEHTPRRA
jgi:hypothetical protein